MEDGEDLIWRAAHLLVKDFAEDAAIQAGQRADKALDEGDLIVYRTWTNVLKAVKEIRSSAAPGTWLN